MTTNDELLAFDNKLKTHRKLLQFLAIEIHKFKKKNLTQDLCGKHIRRKISHIHGEEVFFSQFQT